MVRPFAARDRPASGARSDGSPDRMKRSASRMKPLVRNESAAMKKWKQIMNFNRRMVSKRATLDGTCIATAARMPLAPRSNPFPACGPRTARTSFAVMGIALFAALFTAHCDAYTCTPQPCSDGSSWGRCIACYDDLCTYETRNASGDTVDTCDYKTSDKGARDACFDQTNAAGAAICAGRDPVNTSNKCGQHIGCNACTTAGCAYCASTGECQDYGSGAMCATPTIDLSSDCKN
jgi:hypothetical protein